MIASRVLSLLSALILGGGLVLAADPPKAGDKEPVKKERKKALESKDGAKLFSAEAFKKLQPAADKLYAEKGFDLLIETFDAPPKGTAEKIKAMNADEKEKFYHEIVVEKVKAENIKGVYVLITKTPTYLYVGTTGEAAIPNFSASEMRRVLLDSLKNKKFDEGLAKTIQIALDAKGLGEKK